MIMGMEQVEKGTGHMTNCPELKISSIFGCLWSISFNLIWFGKRGSEPERYSLYMGASLPVQMLRDPETGWTWSSQEVVRDTPSEWKALALTVQLAWERSGVSFCLSALILKQAPLHVLFVRAFNARAVGGYDCLKFDSNSWLRGALKKRLQKFPGSINTWAFPLKYGGCQRKGWHPFLALEHEEWRSFFSDFIKYISICNRLTALCLGCTQQCIVFNLSGNVSFWSCSTLLGHQRWGFFLSSSLCWPLMTLRG